MAFDEFIDKGKIILNVSIMNPDEAYRAIDFFSGGVFALNGEKERLDARSYLFAMSKSTLRHYLQKLD